MNSNTANSISHPWSRREVLRATAGTVLGLMTSAKLPAQTAHPGRVPLGLDAHSLRGMRWKAGQLIEYAAEQRLDAVLFNGLNFFESLETGHLKRLREIANSHSMRIYIGAGSICRNSVTFSDKYGNPETLLTEAIRVAQTIGSPVVNVRSHCGAGINHARN